MNLWKGQQNTKVLCLWPEPHSPAEIFVAWKARTGPCVYDRKIIQLKAGDGAADLALTPDAARQGRRLRSSSSSPARFPRVMFFACLRRGRRLQGLGADSPRTWSEGFDKSKVSDDSTPTAQTWSIIQKSMEEESGPRCARSPSLRRSLVFVFSDGWGIFEF